MKHGDGGICFCPHVPSRVDQLEILSRSHLVTSDKRCFSDSINVTRNLDSPEVEDRHAYQVIYDQ
jgi:hypothetical protein